MEPVKSITCDRGPEFANWQKGTVEKLNGLLREFYPKGRNLSRVSPATLKQNLALSFVSEVIMRFCRGPRMRLPAGV